MFLEWKDVDFERDIIKIQQKDIFSPKTHECRDINIHPYIRSILVSIKSGSHSSFVFGDSTGDRNLDRIYRKPSNGRMYRSAYRKFKDIVKKSGVEDIKKVCIHTLRHSFGSHCIMKGINIVALSKFMGHADIKTTMIYAHLSPGYLKDEMAKLHFDFSKHEENENSQDKCA